MTQPERKKSYEELLQEVKRLEGEAEGWHEVTEKLKAENARLTNENNHALSVIRSMKGDRKAVASREVADAKKKFQQKYAEDMKRVHDIVDACIKKLQKI